MDSVNSQQPELSIDELFQGTTFLPDSEPERFLKLQEQVEKNRYTMFVALYAELAKLFAADSALNLFFKQALDIILSPSSVRAKLIAHPVFQIWNILTFRDVNYLLTGKTLDDAEVKARLLEFAQVLQRIEASQDAQVDEQYPPVYRFDVDPLITQVTPPSYDYPPDEQTRRQLERAGYSKAFFKDVMQLALLRIKHTWPACHEQWQVLVKAVCYLPDGSFRSCSASRYTGVILLSSRDNSILDMEESLVHEATHQLLYNIVEVAAVVEPHASKEALYSLPWSGQQRDLYGYFHAFYVYIALVKYLERVQARPAEEMRRAEQRMLFILRGLSKALADFETAPGFTAQGRELLGNLMQEVHRLERRHAGLLSRGEGASTVAAPLHLTA